MLILRYVNVLDATIEYLKRLKNRLFKESERYNAAIKNL
jgi:hypothetical protein